MRGGTPARPRVLQSPSPLQLCWGQAVASCHRWGLAGAVLDRPGPLGHQGRGPGALPGCCPCPSAGLPTGAVLTQVAGPLLPFRPPGLRVPDSQLWPAVATCQLSSRCCFPICFSALSKSSALHYTMFVVGKQKQ